MFGCGCKETVKHTKQCVHTYIQFRSMLLLRGIHMLDISKSVTWSLFRVGWLNGSMETTGSQLQIPQFYHVTLFLTLPQAPRSLYKPISQFIFSG